MNIYGDITELKETEFDHELFCLCAKYLSGSWNPRYQ